MASVQDRANINRVALEKWTKREQLCLASAVSCSGDQNWMTVSRSLKLLCGAHHPPDWFSQKLCAVKYGELLENVETPKRKKRAPSDNASSVVETPTDSILRRLTEERIQELKSEIREQQETYAKLYTDVVHLQTGNSNEEQIRAMWMEIQREQEQDRQLKTRKQIGTPEMQRNWRQGQFQQQRQQSPLPQNKQEQDMDIDETCKPQGTSPLLSSLLKSSSPVPLTGTTTTTNTVRVNAPTITNLLTGGIISSSVPSSSSSSSPSTSQTMGSLSQPIPLSTPLTGPGPYESGITATPTVLSPSQSAPTLSMLLEKSKSPRDSPNQQQVNSAQVKNEDIKTEPVTEPAEDAPIVVKTEDDTVLKEEPMEDGGLTPTKEEEQQLMEVFKNLMPESIDELADILTNNNGILNTGILEEESILGGVESLIDYAQEVDDQQEVKDIKSDMTEDSKNPQPTEEDSGAKIKAVVSLENDSIDVKPAAQIESANTEVAVDRAAEALKLEKSSEQKLKSPIDEKIETISSDDSSDNVPLATHTKDANIQTVTTADEQIEAAKVELANVLTESVDLQPHEDEGDQPEQPNLAPTQTIEDDDEVVLEDDEESTNKIDSNTADMRKGSLSDCSDVIIIPTDDESNDGKNDMETKKPTDNSDSAVESSNKEEELQTLTSQDDSEKTSQESPFHQEQTITSICLPDTDDDSSTFETPTTTPKDDKSKSSQSKKQESDSRADEDGKHAIVIRKLRDRDRSESPLVEDDASDHSITVRSRRRYSSTPVMDSIPNSPASSEDREYKVWKKSLMTVYNNLLTNKNAAIFLRPFNEEQSPRYKQVCQRPMDLQIIKRHIENGTIRNVVDFQRDVFLMCQNAIMVFKRNSSYAIMARELMHEFVQLKDHVIEAKMDKSFSLSSAYTPGMKIRGSARKSQRLP